MVKRYDYMEEYGDAFVGESEDGDYVSYDDYAALQADHARLQADAERLNWLEDFVRHAYMYGVSFNWTKPCEGEPDGFRFMARHRCDDRQPTLRAAIDAAKEVQP